MIKVRFLHRFAAVAIIGLVSLLFSKVNAQCAVNALATQSEITCGECVTLSHAGFTQGDVVFNENFDNGTVTGWQFTEQATFSNPCDPTGVDGTTHIWMGDLSNVPRALETVPLNFGPGSAPAGGTICFDMMYATQGEDSPCEGPDEPDEGISIQYSVDGGATWITIEYYDPNGGYNPQLTTWNNWCVQLPPGALVDGVQLRWAQLVGTDPGYDHWGLDNIQIIVNDPNVEYIWQHDNYTTALPGENPTQVCPIVTTSYTVNMTSSTGSCQGVIEIVVVNPVVVVDAGADQIVCPGACINLNGTANVIFDPGGPTTFSNNQTENFDASLFGGATVNVNVQDLNMNTINPGSVTQVCLTNLDFTGVNIPPSGVEALSVTLLCPDGNEVELVPIGGAPDGEFIFFPPSNNPSYYENTCFITSGGADLSSVASSNAYPISGTFNSSESLSGMDGCTANGLWSIEVATNALAGSGTFDGWSITFEDEADEYTPDVLWSPTTFMAVGEETTLTPEVCPATVITYTLTASDNAGCVTVTDEVTVTIDPNCCNPQTPPIQGPTPLCENATGNVYSVTNTPGSTYTWTVPAGATITAGQGTNSITVDFATTGGNISVVETINCGDGPSIIFPVAVNACVGCTMDGLTISMTDCYTSGQGFLQYNIEGTLIFTDPPTTGQLIVSDCFLNQQTFNAPFTSPLVFNYTGLPQDGLDCDFGAVFTNDQNCNITTTFTAPPTFTAFAANCILGTGEVDGTIEFNNPPSTGTLIISIDDNTNVLQTEIQPPYNSPESWQVTGLDPGAANYVISYYFSDFPTCEQSFTIICGCSASGGTTTTTLIGNGTTDFILCQDDQFTVTTNNDYVLPDDVGPVLGLPYQPAYVYLVYTCPPTPGVFPGNDPCFVGVIPVEDNIADANTANSLLAQFPPGFFTDNEVFYVPITLYHYDPVVPNYIIFLNCWVIGTTTAVTYLPPITTVVTPDCQSNSVSVVVNGGYPEIYGGDFTASNLQPTTASFVNTIAPNGGAIVIDGLLNGDNYSFDVTDENGCPHTITGGPFVALPITDAGTDAQTCLLSYELAPNESFGVGTWTGGPAGTVFTPDATIANATVTVPTTGAFTFTWTEDNGNGCIASDDVETTFSLMSIPAVITDAACGATDGQIVVAPQGGTTPYTYSWTSGGTAALEPNLSPGNVTVTVTDDTGCSLDSTFTVNQPVTFNYTVTSVDETCFGGCNGEIEILPDGLGSYTYTWTPNVSTSNSEINLCAGDYEVFVTDADDCTQVVNVTIGGPDEVVTQLGSDVTEVCIGGAAILSATTTGGTPAYTYFWTAVPVDPSLVTTDQNPTVSPLVATTYTLVATDASGCTSASKSILVDVLAPLTLNVLRPLSGIDTSICPSGLATIDLVSSGGDGNYSFYLLPDDGNPVTLPLIVEPTVTTTYNFTVVDGCTTPPAFVSVTVAVHPLPTITIEADPDSGCHPLTVNFIDLTQPTPLAWEWNFGDPDAATNTANVADPTHSYSGSGTYNVLLSIITADGCPADTVFANQITVFPLPNANFSLNPEIINLLKAKIDFTDLSNGDIAEWDWSFGDGASATVQNPQHIYGDTGTYIINLMVTTINGCTDEMERQLIVEPDFMFYVPNAFTPNNNKLNDGFRGYGQGIALDSYRFSVFNRWGERLFYTENMEESWDGKYKGKEVELTVYSWRVLLNDHTGQSHKYIGHVTLVR